MIGGTPWLAITLGSFTLILGLARPATHQQAHLELKQADKALGAF